MFFFLKNIRANSAEFHKILRTKKGRRYTSSAFSFFFFFKLRVFIVNLCELWPMQHSNDETEQTTLQSLVLITTSTFTVVVVLLLLIHRLLFQKHAAVSPTPHTVQRHRYNYDCADTL